METIIFDDEITKESITKLINDINKTISNDVNIYFATDGGEIDYTFLLLDFLDNICNKNIQFTCFRDISSAGFVLFLYLKNLNKLKFKILKGTSAIIHKISILIESREKNNTDLDIVYEMNVDFLKIIEKYISKENFKKLKKGEDVYLNYTEIKEIFEK
jgi:ATP-dependent protease ClpP protease subunit